MRDRREKGRKRKERERKRGKREKLISPGKLGSRTV